MQWGAFMWTKAVVDAVGVLLMSAAALLWLWLWEILHNPEPWYLMPGMVGIMFFVSMVFLVTGIYLLQRTERKTDGGNAGDKLTPWVGWRPKPDDEESRILKAGKIKAQKEREETGEPAEMPSTAPGEGAWKPGFRESEAASPYIILGVHEADTLAAIQEVYAKLAAIYDPDGNPDAGERSKAQKKRQLDKINAAYEQICKNHVDASARPPQGEDTKKLYREACALINAKEYARGIQAIFQSIALDPADAGAFVLLGSAYVCLNNYPEAVKAFNRAIELGANNARIFNHRGFSYAQLGDDRRAAEDYDRAIKLDPKFADAFSNRGIVFKGLGDYRRAIEDFNAAIQLDPKFAEAHTLRGLTYGELGGHQSKVEDFKSAARLGSVFAQQYLKEKGVDW